METRILIVDDDPFICRQLEELYTSQRYVVACAPNSTDALRLLGEQDFALAVVDLKIPGTDGIGLTRERIRQIERTALEKLRLLGDRTQR